MYFVESVMICKGKRDQRYYEIIQKYRSSVFRNVLIRIVGELPDPYVARVGVGSMMAYTPKMMVVACIMIEFERITYHRVLSKILDLGNLR